MLSTAFNVDGCWPTAPLLVVVAFFVHFNLSSIRSTKSRSKFPGNFKNIIIVLSKEGIRLLVSTASKSNQLGRVRLRLDAIEEFVRPVRETFKKREKHSMYFANLDGMMVPTLMSNSKCVPGFRRQQSIPVGSCCTNPQICYNHANIKSGIFGPQKTTSI